MYFFFLTLGGFISSGIVQSAVNMLGAAHDPAKLALIIFWTSSLGYVGSFISFWLAGKNYV